jgi:predicted KAP-like P-loop ATPase
MALNDQNGNLYILKMNLNYLNFINDSETVIDYLQNASIAKTVKELISQCGEKPLTIGIHGDWGAGKSSILEMILTDVKENDKDICCIKFNGWQFQGFEDAKISFIETIVKELVDSQTLVSGVKDVAKKLMQRIDWLKVAKKTGGLAFTVATGIPDIDTINGLLSSAKEWISNPKELVTPENAKKTKEWLSTIPDYLNQGVESKKVADEMKGFRQDFNLLMQETKIKKLVVLIDDLDRCLPNVAIELLEAIRLFLFLPNTIFIVAADEAMIEYAVKNHFPNLPNDKSGTEYAKNYLEKLIQIPVRIPALGKVETNVYITLMLLSNAFKDSPNTFSICRSEADKILSTPWYEKTDAFTSLKDLLSEDDYKKIESLLQVASDISTLLCRGTKGNPRQIKRFLNALSLRLSIAKNRGFADFIRPNILIKIMLAEHFLPIGFFQDVTREISLSDEGKSNILKEAESAKVDITENDTDKLSKWASERKHIIEWATLEPKLADIPLKPYLFIIKDSKHYVAGDGISLSENIAQVLELLQKGELSAKSAETQLKDFSQNDLKLIFGKLKDKLLVIKDFKIMPDIMYGIKIIAKTFPSIFESNYLDLLEDIVKKSPNAIWIKAGHNSIVTSHEGKAKLQEILSNSKVTITSKLNRKN